MIKLIIYDLDGTLVDSLADVTASVNAVLTHYNAPAISSQAMQTFFGQGVEALMAAILEPYPHIPVNKAVTLFRTVYAQNMVQKSCLYPGLHPLLQDIERQNIPQAVLTNKLESPAKKLLQELDASRYFDPIAGPDTYSVHKPDPRGLNAILSYHNCPKDQAIMIGDSETDILTAHNAGVPVIAVTYGYRPLTTIQSYNPTYIVESVIQLHQQLSTLITHG